MKILFAQKFGLFWLLLCLSGSAICAESIYPKKMLITVPVADLRAEPRSLSHDCKLPTSSRTNPLGESQLLCGEYIIAHEEHIDGNRLVWLRITALQQERYSVDAGWHGYPGWIRADQAVAVDSYPFYTIVVKSKLASFCDGNSAQLGQLSIGTRLEGVRRNSQEWSIILPDGTPAFIKDTDVYQLCHETCENEERLRGELVVLAQCFMGVLFCWGGRSASSVNCSGLLGLIFLACGLQIPRNAHDQYLQAQKIMTGKELRPGDLVFFSSSKKALAHMHHVMLYVGAGNLIEASHIEHQATNGVFTCAVGSDGNKINNVRLVSCEEKLGKPHTSIRDGDKCGENYVYFGSYVRDPTQRQKLRDKAMQLPDYK